MSKKLLLITTLCTITILTFLPIEAGAQNVPACESDSNPGGLMIGITCTCALKGNCTIKDFSIVLFNIGRWIVGISASIALAFIVFGGGIMITAGGNTARIEQGKNMLRGSIMGLAVILLSWVAVNFIVIAFTGSGSLFGNEQWYNFNFKK